MIIGYDGKRAVNNMTGLGNYSRLVIASMAEAYPTSKMLVYTPKLRENPRLKELQAYHNVEFRLPAAAGFKGSLWRTFGITNNLKADNVEVFHGLSNELPLNIESAGLPSVVTMHDVIYRRRPQCYNAIDRIIYDFKYGRSCHNATRIIAVSQRTKDDVVELYGINPDKIDVIYQGCDSSFRNLLPEDKLEGIRRRLMLPQRYILQVGTIEERKNLALTVRALSTLPKGIKLLVVGRDRKGYLGKVMSIAKELGIASRIDVRHDISFSDLPAVCQLAEVIVYPSYYEGFGIPVLEGLESRRPVVAATGSCLEEAGGDAAFYINPDDAREMGELLRGLTDGTIPYTDRIAKGMEYAKRFAADDMAEKIMATYEKALSEYKR
ncbi:MAG: glycosyltransferase family 4 protein [Muribaculaceae bacterium]|nr:glycosyltransferase family 4 protein [Muribaculaceae bacterium]MDE6753317.1 glycosyltransferase family 4 protein [Muribaculaceae bacterium]